MAEQYSITSGVVALTAATAKTIIELNTGSTINAELIGFDVSFDGSGTGNSAKVDLVSTTATGTGTAYTPVKYGQNQGKPSISTAKVNDTVEPSTPTVLQSWYVPLNSGMSFLWPLGREFECVPSTFHSLRVTAPAGVNVIANLVFEE